MDCRKGEISPEFTTGLNSDKIPRSRVHMDIFIAGFHYMLQVQEYTWTRADKPEGT